MNIGKANMSFQDERPKERFIPNPQARLGDQVREVMRFKHYALRTEQTHLGWIKRFIFFHPKRHPRGMGAVEGEIVASSSPTRLQLVHDRKHSGDSDERSPFQRRRPITQRRNQVGEAAGWPVKT